MEKVIKFLIGSIDWPLKRRYRVPLFPIILIVSLSIVMVIKIVELAWKVGRWLNKPV